MSKENKFRYVFKCSKCGDIVIKEYTLHGIQFGYVDYPEHVHENLRFGYGLKDIVQFTGLKDKTGVEIYEGDIVCNVTHRNKYSVVLEDNPVITTESIDVVVFNPHWCSFEFTSRNERGELEVLGNIYENPELLEGQACTVNKS